MAELPTGTVTFLFTDIEGSTRLLHQLGDRFADALGDHAALLRQAITESGGVEFGSEGDAHFAAFAGPLGAVQAAVDAQRRLAAHTWPLGATLRVRMGLHTGEGALGAANYVGMDVNRAARIAGAAHGGQIILSDATRALVQHALPGGTKLRDIGVHRLKDIVHREHLYDLVIEGLPADFPSPRTLDARPNNLPSQLTSFVGREQEMAEVKRLLSGARLLTLTGPGGTGKTRLALKVAADLLSEFAEGVFFVDLSPVTDPALVTSAVAQAVGIPEVAGRPVLEALKDHLHGKELLLIVDNFEQVAEAAPVIEELLTAAPKLKVMVTSRFVLALRGEHEYVVPPLEPPDPERLPDLPSIRRIEAVQLFTDRALAVQPSFRVTEENAPAVAAIIARLDGLPLAIELAATRTKVLSPEQILPRLEQRLSILTSGARTLPERQRTLRGAIAWSHDLLDAPEQRLFACLSVFTGGWNLESAEVVCEPQELGSDVLDGLTSLVDKSLVRGTEAASGPIRFSMLETIREFGQEQLQAGDDIDVTRRRHAEYFLDLALEAEPHLTAEDQGEWLDRCDQEHPNIRAALRWAVEAGEADRAQAVAGALWRFWHQRGHLDEGRRWFEEVLAMPSGQARTSARAKALVGAGGMAWWQKDREAAGAFYEEAVAIERELGDPERTAEAVYNFAFVVAGRDIDAASRLLEESLELFRRAESEPGVAQVLAMLVIRDAQAGEWDLVIAKLEETTAIWRRLGDRLHIAFDLVWLAFAYGRVGRRSDARSAALEALGLFCQADNPTGVGIVFTDLAFLATWEGRHEDAIRLAGAAESVRQRTGGPPGGFAGILEDDPRLEACAHLPEDVAQQAWEEGICMSLDEAVAFAREAGAP
jgi:predicted ATPase/class 3 adenylate cyclase